jgi:mRNA interferase RelE/StbE
MRFRAKKCLRFWNPPSEDSVPRKLRARHEVRARQEAGGRVKECIEAVEKVDSLGDLPNLKKLKGTKGYFRLKLGDYRIGLALEDNTLVFVRFLDRKDIYKYFPKTQDFSM